MKKQQPVPLHSASLTWAKIILHKNIKSRDTEVAAAHGATDASCWEETIHGNFGFDFRSDSEKWNMEF